MKKLFCMLMAAVLLLGLCACGQQESAEEAKEWSRAGYFTNDNGDMLSVVWMEEIDEPGWYVGVMLGEIMAGGTLPQEGSSLHGSLESMDEGTKPLTVTLSEEGKDGLLLEVEGGESFHFVPSQLPEAKIIVTVNTEGWGNIAYAIGAEAPEIDPERPYQTAQINLAEPETYTFVAWPHAGNVFQEWMKNGEEFSEEPQITVELTESADFVAVFEEDADWQNPVMNFVGEYQSGRAHALVECWDKDEAMITIDWGSSAWETARWLIGGKLDLETLSIAYEGCSKSILTFDEKGEVKSQETVYEDGTGTITFHDDGTFTWHEDQSEYGEDLVFEWLPVEPEGDEDELPINMSNPWREITEEEARNFFTFGYVVPEGAENVVWSVLESADANPLLQLSFDLNGQHYTARMQATDDPEADISGMFYAWADTREIALQNWGEGEITAVFSRFVGENEYDAELCTWFDAETGISYAVGVQSEDLEGFDLQAIVEAMAPVIEEA